MIHGRHLAIAFASVLLSSSSEAQADIRGVVLDSLRGGALSGALVRVEGVNATAFTDARGRFEIANVPIGTRRIVVQSPFLDSIAVGPLAISVDFRGTGQRVVLATPSLVSYQRAVCGTALDAEQGIVLGNAQGDRGEAVGGMQVAALWNEAVLTAAGATGLIRAAVDTTTGAGFYAICGVPYGADYQLRAGDDTLGTDVLSILASSDRIRRRDVRVGGADRVARIRGRLVGVSGTALSGSVDLIGDSTSALSTGSDGLFEVTVPARSIQLWVRVIGYSPRLVDVESIAGDVDLGDLVLETVPQELPGRLIEGRLVSEAEFAFEERRRAGVGVHLDSARLAKFPVVTVNAVISEARIARRGSRGALLLRKGADYCAPRIFLNGTYIGKQIGQPSVREDELNTLLSQAKRIEMYTAPYAPPAFTDFDGCGALLIWTT